MAELGELERKLRENARAKFRADVTDAFDRAFAEVQGRYAAGLMYGRGEDGAVGVPSSADLADWLLNINGAYVETLALDEAVRRLTPVAQSRAVAPYKNVLSDRDEPDSDDDDSSFRVLQKSRPKR